MAVTAPWLLAPVGSDTAQITAIVWTKLCFQMSLVGAPFHRNICCRSQEGSCRILSRFEFSAQLAPTAGHTCLCSCTTDLETRRYPQEMPGLVLLTASPAWICPVQIATPPAKGSKCALAAAPTTLPSGKLSSFFNRLGWSCLHLHLFSILRWEPETGTELGCAPWLQRGLSC